MWFKQLLDDCSGRSLVMGWIFLMGVLFALTPLPARAQPGEDGGYRLGARDVIQVVVLNSGQKEFEVKLVVSEQGTITVPLMGNVMAKGLTIPELEKKLYEPLERDFFVNPQVHVTVEEYHSLSYFIAGAIKLPGMYELSFTPSLMDLIVKAGGAEEGRGSVAYILRNTNLTSRSNKALESEIQKREPIRVDLIQLLDQGDMAANIMLEPGDTVYIPLGKALDQATSMVYVQGQVKEPGMFDFQPGMTALGACILAGGFTKYAAPGRTLIVRNQAKAPETIRINLEKVIEGKLPDLPLQPGDRINVPQSWF